MMPRDWTDVVAPEVREMRGRQDEARQFFQSGRYDISSARMDAKRHR